MKFGMRIHLKRIIITLFMVFVVVTALNISPFIMA
jgi:hypothetical protein